MSLNISDFSFFCVKIATHPWKKLLPLFQQPPSQSWGSVKPVLFKNLVGGSTSPTERGSVHTMLDLDMDANIVNIKSDSVCIKQHLNNIWSYIYEKVKQHWGWIEKIVK